MSMIEFLQFIFFFLFVLSFGIAGMIFISQLFEYMKKNHADIFESMTYKTLFGIPSDYLWTALARPIKFFKFIFSSDDLNDKLIRNYKMKIRLLYSLICILFFAFIIF